VNPRFRWAGIGGNTQGESGVAGQLDPGACGWAFGEASARAFRWLAGAEKLPAGSVFLEGQEITRWPMFQRARAGMALLTQPSAVMDRMSVRENLVLAAQGAGKKASEADRLLDVCGLAGRGAESPGQLLLVERRILELARASVLKPKVLLWDSPDAGISDSDFHRVEPHLRSFTAEGAAVLMFVRNPPAPEWRVDLRWEVKIPGEGFTPPTSGL